ncbi:MAG: hypothetical protein WBB67_01620 [bacterium]
MVFLKSRMGLDRHGVKPFLRNGDKEKGRHGEMTASQMKKLFLTEFDGSDKIADYSDGKEWGRYGVKSSRRARY